VRIIEIDRGQFPAEPGEANEVAKTVFWEERRNGIIFENRVGSLFFVAAIHSRHPQENDKIYGRARMLVHELPDCPTV